MGARADPTARVYEGRTGSGAGPEGRSGAGIRELVRVRAVPYARLEGAITHCTRWTKYRELYQKPREHHDMPPPDAPPAFPAELPPLLLTLLFPL